MPPALIAGVLVMGCAFSAFMGFDQRVEDPAFIITLAGIPLRRQLSHSEESASDNHAIYDTLQALRGNLPGGGRLSAMRLLMLAVVVSAYSAHYPLGNQVRFEATQRRHLMGFLRRAPPFAFMLSTDCTLAGLSSRFIPRPDMRGA